MNTEQFFDFLCNSAERSVDAEDKHGANQCFIGAQNLLCGILNEKAIDSYNDASTRGERMRLLNYISGTSRMVQGAKSIDELRQLKEDLTAIRVI